MTLQNDTYEQTLKELAVFPDMATLLEGLRDPDEIPYELLPALAELLGGKLYTEILGEEYARRMVRKATLYNDLTGTYAALDEFAEDIGITYSVETVRNNRNAIIRYIVTVSAIQIQGVNLNNYIVQSILALLPEIVAFIDGNQVRLSIGFAGVEYHIGNFAMAGFADFRTAT